MCTDTDKHMVTEACACHAHIFTSLSVVMLGTVCLAQRQAFREGVRIEWTPRIPEMNCEVERCLLAFKWLGGISDRGSPVTGLHQERGPRPSALEDPRGSYFSHPFSDGLEPLGPTGTQGQEEESPSPFVGLLI